MWRSCAGSSASVARGTSLRRRGGRGRSRERALVCVMRALRPHRCRLSVKRALNAASVKAPPLRPRKSAPQSVAAPAASTARPQLKCSYSSSAVALSAGTSSVMVPRLRVVFVCASTSFRPTRRFPRQPGAAQSGSRQRGVPGALSRRSEVGRCGGRSRMDMQASSAFCTRSAVAAVRSPSCTSASTAATSASMTLTISASSAQSSLSMSSATVARAAGMLFSCVASRRARACAGQRRCQRRACAAGGARPQSLPARAAPRACSSVAACRSASSRSVPSRYVMTATKWLTSVATPLGLRSLSARRASGSQSTRRARAAAAARRRARRTAR